MKKNLSLVALSALFLGGCASTTSVDGRETLVIGYGRMTEGKSDRRAMMGEPASIEAKKPSVPASNVGMSSDSMRAVWGAPSKEGQ